MVLRLSDIKKSYGEQTVLEGFSYAFPDRGLYLLTGASGAGKTTLLRLIAGLEVPDSGTVERDGNVSYLFQDKRLFEGLSALENVRIVAPRDLSKADAVSRARDLLSALGISDFDQKKKVSEMSGGMQQRVAIARALSFEAPILLLDEPSKELDADNRETLRKLFSQEAKKRLVILVSHQADDISLPEAVAVPVTRGQVS